MSTPTEDEMWRHADEAFAHADRAFASADQAFDAMRKRGQRTAYRETSSMSSSTVEYTPRECSAYERGRYHGALIVAALWALSVVMLGLGLIYFYH